MHLSAIITVSSRQKRGDVKSLYHKYKKSIQEAGVDSEFIYVTDDTSDELLGQLQELQQKGEDIKIVKVARWFGDAVALNMGFDEAAGDLILTLPAVQQVSEKEIPAIIHSLDGSDMVIARRTRKKDNIFLRFQAKIFHYLVRLFLGMHYRDLGCRVRLFKRDVLNHIYLYGDQIRFLPLLANKYGFKVTEIDVVQSFSGTSSRVYSPGHYAERIVDLISIFFLIKFTKKPLRFFGFPGFIIFVAGLLLSLYLLYERIVLDLGLADRPIVLVSILLIVFGIQLFAIGLVAEIIIFTHSKDSKEYIVEKVIGGKKEELEKIHLPKVEEEV
jgi:glycosyltransferase involved in cell wall biosynthesis